MLTQLTSGVVMIHSAPRAFCSHLEWAVAACLENGPSGLIRRDVPLRPVDPAHPVSFEWLDQPLESRCVRGEASFVGRPGVAADIVTVLKDWGGMRFEVYEYSTKHSDGARWSFTPSLGLFHAQLDSLGSVVVPEDRLRQGMSEHAGDARSLTRHLSGMLGEPWDVELEDFRQVGEECQVKLMQRA